MLGGAVLVEVEACLSVRYPEVEACLSVCYPETETGVEMEEGLLLPGVGKGLGVRHAKMGAGKK